MMEDSSSLEWKASPGEGNSERVGELVVAAEEGEGGVAVAVFPCFAIAAVPCRLVSYVCLLSRKVRASWPVVSVD